MRSLSRSALLLGLLLAATGGFAATPSASAGTRARPDVIRLRRVSLTDSQIFSQPVEIVSLLIPSDWRFQGSFDLDLARFQGCPENAFLGKFQAESPNAQVGVAVFPAFQTIHFQNPILAEDARRRTQAGQGFCPLQAPMNLAQFVEQVLVPVFRPGAKVQRVEPLKALQQTIRQQISAMPLPPNLQVDGDAAEVVISYTLNGAPIEEHIYLVGGWRGERVPGGAGGPDIVYSVYTPLLGLRVPAGQFQRYKQQFANIIASTRANPRFHAAIGIAIQQQRTNIFNNFIDQIRQTSAIWRASWEAASNANRQKEAAAAQRRTYDVAGAWSDTVLDVQNYKDANGETVQLSGGYSHVYSNRNGEYIQTNDPSYNPNVGATQQWDAIAAIPR